MNDTLLAVCMKVASASSCRSLVEMEMYDLLPMVFFFVFVSFVTWACTCRTGRAREPEVDEDFPDIFTSFNDWRRNLEGRLNYLGAILSSGKLAMSQHNFRNAIDVFDMGIAYAAQCKLDQTQPSRDVWAKLHQMKSLCYWHLGDYIQSMKEIDSALRVSRNPNIELLLCAHHAFQLFNRWTSENIRSYGGKIGEYLRQKFSRLKDARNRGYAYPYLLVEATHCFLLTDSLTAARISGVRSLATVDETLSLCQHFVSLLPVVNNEPETVNLPSTGINRRSPSNISQELNSVAAGNVSCKKGPSAPSCGLQSSVGGQSQTMQNNNAVIVNSNNNMDRKQNLDDVKPTEMKKVLVVDEIQNRKDLRQSSELTTKKSGVDQHVDPVIVHSDGPEPVVAQCFLGNNGSNRKANGKRSRRIKKSKATDVVVNEPKGTLFSQYSDEIENGGTLQDNEDGQRSMELGLGASVSNSCSVADNFRVVLPWAVNIFGGKVKSRTEEPRSSSVKLFAELFGLYGDRICLACEMCLNIETEDTNKVKINPYQHNCKKDRLVIAEKTSQNAFGALIRLRPWAYNPFQGKSLCESIITKHACIEKQRCKLPHGDLERSLWMRDYNKEISLPNFIHDLEHSTLRSKHLVSYLKKKFRGDFQLICRRCFEEKGHYELKTRHVPQCKQGHFWEGNEKLMFKCDDRSIDFDESENNTDPEYSELFGCVRSLILGMKPKEIAEESRKLCQQISARKSVDLQESNADVEADADGGPDGLSDVKPINIERDEDVFDEDFETVLNPLAFDDDSGDTFGANDDEKEEMNVSFEPYYVLLKDEDLTDDRYRRGTIHLNGVSDAVCRLQDGWDLRISGRMNCGPAFDGDEVVVELKECKIKIADSDEKKNEALMDIRGSVVQVKKRNTHRAARTFVCTVDKYRSNLMRPLCGTVPKFHMVDSELERKFGKERKLGYVAVYDMKEKGLALKKTIQLNPKSREEMLFVVKYLKWNPRHMYPLGYVCKVIRTGNDIDKSICVLNLVYEISSEEPENCNESIQNCVELVESERFSQVDSIDRRDLRELFTVSIDPDGCKDVDDALSVEEVSEGLFKVWVHIADVGHFVKKGDAVDEAARRRAMSFYPEGTSKSIHMLHSRLATNIFSLLEDKDRYAITIIFKLDSDGNLHGMPEITRSLMKNKKQLSYEFVQEIIDYHQKEDLLEDKNDLDCCIVRLHRLAVQLRARRMKNSQFYYDYEIGNFLRKEGIRDPFEVDQCHEAHRLVEEFMILANETVANYLLRKFPHEEVIPFRQQNEPNRARANEWFHRNKTTAEHSFFFDNYFENYFRDNIDEAENERMNRSESESFAMLKCSWESLCEAMKKGDIRKLQTILGSERLHPIHSLTLNDWFAIQESAKFTPMRLGARHFGLQTSHYVQFTSPIRRFMDIVVHRLVQAAIDDLDSPYTELEIQKLCEKANHRMSLAKSYSRSCIALKMADMLAKPFYMPCVVGKLDMFGIQLKVPFFNHTTHRQQEIKYSALNVNRIPKVEEEKKVQLSWEKRFYDTRAGRTLNARNKTNVEEQIMLSSELQSKMISRNRWSALQEAVTQKVTDAGFLEQMNRLMKSIQADQQTFSDLELGQRLVADVTSEMTAKEMLVKHHVSFSTDLRRGSVLAAQFGRDVVDGFLQPSVRLINLTESKDICIEHRTKPVKCFASLASRKTRMHYTDITEYQQIWIPILHMESATNAASSDDPIMCNHVPIKFSKQNDVWLGQLTLKASFCRERHIKLFVMPEEENETHDYLCIRYHLDARYPRSLIRNVWMCHAVAVHTNSKEKPNGKNDDITLMFRVSDYSSEPPEELRGNNQECTVEFLYRTLPDKHMAKAVESLLLPKSSELCRKIALGMDLSSIIEPVLTSFTADSFHIEDVFVRGERKYLKNNERQDEAIRTCLRERFTLVQGPPGTGKTLIGVKIAYWFVQMNLQSEGSYTEAEVHSVSTSDDDSEDEFPALRQTSRPRKRQVLFCGPSNSSVDVAAKQLITRLGNKCPKIVRVYSEMWETMDFPVPRDLLITKSLEKNKHKRRRNLQDDPQIQKIALHRIIRREGKPYSRKILQFDQRFARNMATPEKVTEDEVSAYKRLILKASVEELKYYDIILCTCTVSSCARQTRGTRIAQIIIDECGMCKEPESLIPLVTFPTAERIVLIGDHKQLQPIIRNSEATKLGLNVSLFQRYAEEAEQCRKIGGKSNIAFVMLNLQYRMNEKICEFPSEYFYGGELKTAKNSKWFKKEDHFLKIWPNLSYPLVFCHVEGTEKSQAVTTAEGNEDSKSNAEECYHVLRYARELINTLWLLKKYESRPDKNIAILSQYKAQCSLIKDELESTGLQCDVSTVVASQGGEWDYVILSTVRSLPEYEIDRYPSDGWCMRNLGFICDLHQINVALTRARMGLIIIGNKNLLKCDKMWNELLSRYEQNGCVVNAEDFLKTALIPGYAEHEIPRYARRPQTVVLQ